MPTPSISCCRRLCFSAGHRLMYHENKCSTPHGHSYCAEVTAEAEALDAVGRVVDFALLKERLGGWIDEHWDHTFLVYEGDKEMIAALQMVPSKKPPFLCPFHPTAENMATYLLQEVAPKVFDKTGIAITRVRLYESENCFAEAWAS